MDQPLRSSLASRPPVVWREFLTKVPRFTQLGWFHLVVVVLLGWQANQDGSAESRSVLVLVSAVLASLVVVNFIELARRLESVRIKAEVRDVVLAGESAALKLRVTSAAWLPTCQILVSAPNRGDGFVVRSPTIRLPWFGRSVRHEAMRVTFLRRGLVELGAVEVKSTFPFGLAVARRILPLGCKVLVLPKPARLSRQAMENIFFGSGAGQSVSREYRGVEDFRGLREYLPGDPVNHIHWRTSARVQRPMILELEDRAHPSVRVVLDGSVEGDAQRSGHQFERLVSLASGIIKVGMGMGVRCGLRLHDGTFQVSFESSGDAAAFRMQQMLALVCSGGAPVESWIEQALDELEPGARMIVLSTRESLRHLLPAGLLPQLVILTPESPLVRRHFFEPRQSDAWQPEPSEERVA